MLLRDSIDLARKLAADFEVSLTELAIEIAVCRNLLDINRELADGPDDQIGTANGTPCQRLRTCPDEPIIFILNIENT